MAEKIRAQLATGASQYRKVLLQARNRNANESDTAIIVHSMLADIFGYDRFTEVTSEYKIKGQFADLATKIGDKSPRANNLVTQHPLHRVWLDAPASHPQVDV